MDRDIRIDNKGTADTIKRKIQREMDRDIHIDTKGTADTIKRKI